MAGGERDTDDAQRAAFEAEARRIRAMQPEIAFEAAGELVQEYSELRGLAAVLRSEQAQRVLESGDLSVTELARRLGITKQRADQLLKRARRVSAD